METNLHGRRREAHSAWRILHNIYLFNVASVSNGINTNSTSNLN